jgi:hypothetical protein
VGDRIVNPQTAERRTWQIDGRLQALLGCPVRVAAESLFPSALRGEVFKHLITPKNFILPDGTTAEPGYIYVEGVLRDFRRHVALVFVELDALPFEGSAEGRVIFRGTPAVILRGPATVQLDESAFVERVPADANAYWAHLLSTHPQMDFSFSD